MSNDFSKTSASTVCDEKTCQSLAGRAGSNHYRQASTSKCKLVLPSSQLCKLGRQSANGLELVEVCAFCAQFFDPSFSDGFWSLGNSSQPERTHHPKFYDVIPMEQRAARPQSRDATQTRLLAKRLVQATTRRDYQVIST